MDFRLLQGALRRFAAERDWQPFHTPKNLAMALLVEAAELVEIFQWLTPDQSLALSEDAAQQERVADEIADVLLYLVQIADRLKIDIDASVDRKLLKNRRKHPAIPSGPVIEPTRSKAKTHVLIDWENVQPRVDELLAIVPGATDLWLFHGPNQKDMTPDYASFGERLQPVKIARTGKNALDFHLTFYIGYIASRDPDARFVVVSNDKGYAPVLEHARQLRFSVEQIGYGQAPSSSAEGKKEARKAPPSPTVSPKTGAKKSIALKVKSGSVPAKKPAAAKLLVATATTATRPAPASKAIRTSKSLEQVVTMLKKTPIVNRPRKHARLLAHLASMIGADPDASKASVMLGRLVDGGHLTVDDKQTVSYML